MRLFPPLQGEWAVTAQQEAEEKRRMQDFQNTVPKMRSQLQILTHFYQVRLRPGSAAGRVLTRCLPLRASCSSSWFC